MQLFHLACICAYISSASASFGPYNVHEKRTVSALNWQKRSRAQPGLSLPMRLALAQENLDTAAESLMHLSDPNSPQFSQYWNAKEVARKFAPKRETVEKVMGWLNNSGIQPARVKRSHSGGWLDFNATVQEAERILNTKYHLYQHRGTGEIRAACDEYSVPASVRRYIDFVTPTVHLGETLRHRKDIYPRTGGIQERQISEIGKVAKGSNNSLCSQFTTIDCLRTLYNIPIDNTSHPSNSFGIFEVAWVSWLPGDLDMFFSKFMPPLVGHRPSLERIDGGYWQDTVKFFTFNGEADVDMEYAMSLVYPLKITNYQVGDQFLTGTLNDLLAAFDQTYCGSLDAYIDGNYPDPQPGGYNSSDCGTRKPANVLSISYVNDEIAYPPAYEQRECLEYLKLGLQGVSVLVAAGDWGVAGLTDQCIDPATNQSSASPKAGTAAFNPGFPASCPYVTAVGGTQLRVNASVTTPETVFQHAVGNHTSTSGGGFSNVFARPAYQSHAVHHYLDHEASHLSTLAAHFNASGRAFPDVSANAVNYVTAVDGQFTTVYGTSASTPVFASVVAKLNDARLRVGKRPVGFLNPVLYAHPHVLNDVQSGSNAGCGGEGFRTCEGWDPATGLGTPDFKRMLDLYLQLP